jgi:2-C-methyl-D-erythritol 4-phosphate cytidylyltransferase
MHWMNEHETVVAIVAAAGSGRRMGADKTMCELHGKPLLAWAVDVLQQSPLVDRIILVLHKDNLAGGEKLASARGWGKVSSICVGGELRQDSVRNGLLRAGDCQWVMIQDGARPFLTDKLISDGLAAVRETGAAAAAVPVADTIKEVDIGNYVLKTLNRSALRALQTPQVFRFAAIMKAYEKTAGEATDDAALVERAGYRIKIYAGDYNNIKVTTPEDFRLAEIIASGR